MNHSINLEDITTKRVSDKLHELGNIRTFAEGDVILEEASCVNSIPIVTQGIIKVTRTEEDGREIFLYYIKPGESCIMSILGGLHQETSKVRAIADEKTEILFVPIEKVSSLIKEYPEWLDYIFKLYHKRFEELLDVVNAIAFKKLDERLLDLIQKKCDNAESKTLHITHEQLANELGTARVVVSRLLKQMESENLVKLGRNNISLM